MARATSDGAYALSDSYPVPVDSVEVEDVIRRSRFITVLGRAASREEAGRFVQQVRERFPGATHHCWAFNAGTPGSTTHIGLSDDGEPHGTAGRPMLTSLLHSGVGEVVAVCTRYYGGVKLGTGGLARAYASGVKRALEACTTVLRVERETVLVTVAYGAVEPVERVFERLDAIVTDRAFADDVRYRLRVSSNRRAELVAAVADATGGQGLVRGPPE